jgi:hypothetical protein
VHVFEEWCQTHPTGLATYSQQVGRLNEMTGNVIKMFGGADRSTRAKRSSDDEAVAAAGAWWLLPN